MRPVARPRLFPKPYVRQIVQDVLDVSKLLQHPPIGESRPEECLTKQIYGLLKRKSRYYTGPLTPEIESWLPDLESRADIKFTCGKGLETYFIIEAKRLFVTQPGGKPAALVAEYVNDGMLRFLTGRYAPHQQTSAMLGYVFKATPQAAATAVGHAVEAKRRALRLCGTLKPSPLPVKPSVMETLHRLRAKPFTLYHLFVPIPHPTTP